MFKPFCSADLSTVALKDKRALLAELKDAIKTDVALNRESRAAVKAAKTAKRDANMANRIAKAQERLQKLLDKANPVGSKAIKAARRAGKVTIIKAA
jgi:hypothetical protein